MPQYEDVYEPPILDSTGQAILQAIQALSAPSATDVAVSTANMHYITEDDAQGAISELDAKAYEINSSLTKLSYSPASTPSGFDRVSIAKTNNLVELVIILDNNASVSENGTIGYTLPLEVRPATNRFLLGYNYNADKVYLFQLLTDGTIQLYGKGTCTKRTHIVGYYFV